MLKDLKFDPVSGVEVAIAKTPEKTGESTFYLYIINHKELDLKNLLVMTEAEEKEDGSGRKTSKLRHFFELLAAGESLKVETVDPSVLSFYNRVWLSFYIDGQVYDRRYMIEPFKEWDLEPIEALDLKGRKGN
ncbi:hypothetical protein [Croceimicrobium hydrocarbonivorans]|uniref:Uncharacterized protein n=1 Tax=Croceimicrobium hydrocarbonivorans TaxID=2761580 RepID=A0A7H0VDE6_9FLAO|nr:hypothetical protein [Croceimicrobium hydrocarbonivorans]QNR23744.1 hypothetical protein H4K34_15400 [Croceimicrobium hydrocarbonivorans]